MDATRSFAANVSVRPARLRNGGTYWTRRECGVPAVTVEELPHRKTDDGSVAVDIPDTRDGSTRGAGERDLELVEKILGSLDPRERTTLSLRYGIGVDYAHTRQEVADVLCVTREQVEEIEQAAISRLGTLFGPSISVALSSLVELETA